MGLDNRNIFNKFTSLRLLTIEKLSYLERNGKKDSPLYEREKRRLENELEKYRFSYRLKKGVKNFLERYFPIN